MNELSIFLIVAAICAPVGYGTWNQYRLYGRICAYYKSVAAFMIFASSLAYFFTYLVNPNKNIGWLSISLFLIIPAIILNVGIAIEMIRYGGTGLRFKERIRLMFGIPKEKRSALFPVPNRHLIYSGFVGYVIALILSVIYSPKDFLIISAVVLSELFIVVAPLKLESRTSGDLPGKA